ncbi:MAG: hypothetical protein DME24_11585, partial [Verrucomicrobia bacterium]
GKWLAAGETDGRIRFFDLITQSEKSRFVAHAEGITALAFSPDGTLVASGSGYADGSVKLWQVPTGEPAGTLLGHNAWIPGLAFAPDGKTLASASSDQTIRLWDVAKRDVSPGETGAEEQACFCRRSDRFPRDDSRTGHDDLGVVPRTGSSTRGGPAPTGIGKGAL